MSCITDKELKGLKKELHAVLNGKPGYTGISMENKMLIVHVKDKNESWTKEIPPRYVNRTRIKENTVKHSLVPA